ncbi:MAG TPA: Ig domain-containing protein, partial [Prosthecobacter sp.]
QGRTLVLNARVTAPAGASISYAWQRGEEDLSDGERISGSKDKTLKITEIGTPESETYTCRVTMTVDGQSATLPHGDTEVTVLEPPSLAAPVFADRYVGEPVSYPVIASNHPSQFTATGLPPGVVINKQTGLISGSPIAAKLVQGENVAYRVTITVSNAAGKDSKSADWKILPLPAGLAGSYHGLVAREGSLNRGLGGSFKLSVQPSASFSGQLTLGAKKHAFTGKLEVAGNGTLAEATITIRRGSALADLNLVFSLHPATGGLSGTVSFNGSEESSQITARRSPWSKVEKPDAYVGTYNAALQPQLPPEVLAGIYPEGEGYAILKITATGVATWSGRLADGSAITCSTNLVQGGQVTLHSLSYKNTASVQGWSTLSSPGKNLDGTLDWVKLNIENPGKERTYQEGFPRHPMTVVGGVYTPPPGGELLPALAPTSSNAQITFVCDGALEPFTQSFSLTPGGKVTMPMNDTKLKLQLNAKTGIYNGSFTLTEPDPTSLLEVKPKVTRGASFSGALIQRLGRGAGYSLVPRLPARAGEKTTQTPLFSGSASLTKAVSDN